MRNTRPHPSSGFAGLFTYLLFHLFIIHYFFFFLAFGSRAGTGPDLINMFVLGRRVHASGECSALLCDIFILGLGFSGSP